MFTDRIRRLSHDELALVAGGAGMETVSLGTVEVRPPDDPWPFFTPPDFSDPFDPGLWDGGGGGGVAGAFEPLPQENRIDEDFIARMEGQQQLVGYVPNNAGVVIGSSGVTIATGVDLGSKTAAGLATIGVEPELIAVLNPYLQLSGTEALRAIQDNPLTITQAQASALDTAVRGEILGQLVEVYSANSSYADFYQLPGGVQTAIASVAYQYGPALVGATPEFWMQIIEGRWQDAVDNLRDFHDAYDSRRGQEADLIEADIASGAIPAGR